MKIKLSHNVYARHYIENKPFNQPQDFQAGQELIVNKENIQNLPNGDWQICYFDSDKEVTYPFIITQDEIKIVTTKEILCLSVIESEFEELIKIPRIKELIDSEKVVIYLYDSDNVCESLDTYEPFQTYYKKLSEIYSAEQ
ncbi:hypothetical protein Cylst_4221 [Cylindrospermum stagnale PCC 7417]|uniref:Uncharacterized protein n=1 Tax=Cylindrospermum stagnale PCC 7417 TaxID=56107 RepID=K9X126_9NOST|nr:hypothetical protein [Cylindrospermum stagnale]AFZ26320.1 hypothetical protein Cylst_4221 [Cylindrospermum stagnale PCC 7417]